MQDHRKLGCRGVVAYEIPLGQASQLRQFRHASTLPSLALGRSLHAMARLRGRQGSAPVTQVEQLLRSPGPAPLLAGLIDRFANGDPELGPCVPWWAA